jgi:hypothetical protein
MSKTTLLASAATIKDETSPRANTATRVGNMFEDIINQTSSHFSVTIAQADVRLLNTSNSGYGYELLPALSSGQCYVISNPLYRWVCTGGAFIDAIGWLYYEGSQPLYMNNISSSTGTPINFLENTIF